MIIVDSRAVSDYYGSVINITRRKNMKKIILALLAVAFAGAANAQFSGSAAPAAAGGF